MTQEIAMTQEIVPLPDKEGMKRLENAVKDGVLKVDGIKKVFASQRFNSRVFVLSWRNQDNEHQQVGFSVETEARWWENKLQEALVDGYQASSCNVAENFVCWGGYGGDRVMIHSMGSGVNIGRGDYVASVVFSVSRSPGNGYKVLEVSVGEVPGQASPVRFDTMLDAKREVDRILSGAGAGQELKPCPFCSCAVRVLHGTGRYPYYINGRHEPGCVLFSVDLKYYAYAEEALNEWNARMG